MHALTQHHPTNRLRTFAWVLAQVLLLGAAVFLLSGCTMSGSMLADEDIPDGTDRIVIDRTATEALVTDESPATGFFTDVYRYLEGKGIDIDQRDPDNLILTTHPTTVEDSLQLRFNMIFEPIAGGSRMIASAQYATQDGSNWQAAAWTDGTARDAFGEAVQIFDDLSFSEFSTARSSNESAATDAGTN